MSEAPYLLLNADCREAMAELAPDSVDAIVCDPPYMLEFMGSKWDKATPQQAYDFHLSWAKEALRVLKPGAYLLAFGGTRTFHRLAAALEDSGLQLRDCLVWLYSGNSFPKHRSCLKPAWEPILLCRKPAERVKTLNIDTCRVNGRWPSNVALDQQAALLLDSKTKKSKSRKAKREQAGDDKSLIFKGLNKTDTIRGYDDEGGVSRFYYVAKASSSEREAGLEGMPYQEGEVGKQIFCPPIKKRNTHPTVKPIALMQHLCRLITPEGGVVLDPFLGSGTTGIAALKENFQFIGVEQSPEFFEIASKRVQHHYQEANPVWPIYPTEESA